jgi:hypothetical protein
MSTRRRLAVSLVAAAAAASAVPLFVGSSASSAPAPAQCPSQPSYDYTIPTPVGPPAAVALPDGEFPAVGFAALGSDRKLYYNEADITGDPLLVSPLACLGGIATDAPAVIQTLSGGRAFFVRVADGRIYYRFTDSDPSTPDFSSTGSFFPISNVNATNAPAAIQTTDGVYHLFLRGGNGALYHGFLQSSGTWRFENLGGSISGTPSVVQDGTRVLVAVTTPTGSIYTKRGTTFAWGPFVKVLSGRTVNGPALTTQTGPSLAKDLDTGAITMYAAASNQGLYSLTKAANVGFPSAATPWTRIDTVLPATARIAAAEVGDNAIVYATWNDKATGQIVTAYTQFLPDQGWLDYALAPYSCYNCAPDASGVGATTAGKKAADSPGNGDTAGTARKEVLDSQKG